MKNLSKEEVRTAVMTLQECKEEIAKLYGFDNWDRIDFYMLDSQDQTAQRPYAEERLNDEVAELYASQFKSQSEAVGWISVKERLPLTDEYVLITDGIEVWVGNYERSGYRGRSQWGQAFIGCSMVDDTEITHWQPLPSPPKSEQPQERHP